MADPLPPAHPPRIAVKPKRVIRKPRHSKVRDHKRSTTVKRKLHGLP